MALLPCTLMPHAKAVTQRLLAALADGQSHHVDTLVTELDTSLNSIRMAVYRLRARGATIILESDGMTQSYRMRMT